MFLFLLVGLGVQCNTTHYNTTQYNTTQCNTIQYNTAQRITTVKVFFQPPIPPSGSSASCLVKPLDDGPPSHVDELRCGRHVDESSQHAEIQGHARQSAVLDYASPHQHLAPALEDTRADYVRNDWQHGADSSRGRDHAWPQALLV